VVRSNEHWDFDGSADQYLPDAGDLQRLPDGEADGANYLKTRKPTHRATASGARLAQQERRIAQLETYIHSRMSGREEADNTPVSNRFRGNRIARMIRQSRQSRSAFMWRKTIIFCTGAMVLGTFGAVIVYDSMRDRVLSVTFTGAIAQLSAAFATQGHGIADGEDAAASVRVEPRSPVSKKKPIVMASLDVTDVKGSVNTLIPLDIGTALTSPDREIALRLSGLPDDAYLTAGTKLADSSWILKRGEEMDIKLKVPSPQSSPLLIGVEAIDWRTGDFAAPPEELKVVLDAGSASTAPQVEPVDFARRCDAQLQPAVYRANHGSTACASPARRRNEHEFDSGW
jgi:hypothetical protein